MEIDKVGDGETEEQIENMKLFVFHSSKSLIVSRELVYYFHLHFLKLKVFFKVKMGKEKKEKKALDESQTNGTNGDTTDEISYEDRLNFVSVIAKPMASKKLAKKVSIL